MDIKEFAQQHPKTAVVIGLTVLGVVVELVDKFITSVTAVDWVIRSGVSVDTRGELRVAIWFELLVLLAFALLIIVLAMYWASRSQIQKSQNANDQKVKPALQALEGMISAAFKIRQQFMPGNKQQFSSFSLVKSQYFISKDFTAEVVREFHIKASTEPIHFFEISMGAEPEAPPMEYLTDINFTVRDASKHIGEVPFETAYLPCVNQPHQKRIIVFCLPFINPAEPGPRMVQVTFKWAGYFRHLEQNLHETLAFSFPLTTKDIDLLQCEVYLEPGTGRKLVSNKQGSTGGKQDLKQTPILRNNVEWQGYTYAINGAPSGEYALNLELKVI